MSAWGNCRHARAPSSTTRSCPSKWIRAADLTGQANPCERSSSRSGEQNGLFSSHVSLDFGGLGLDHMSKAMLFEEAGYSPLGPVALNIAAPDEGNMHLLHEVTAPEQKER
ncbi:hypothetical protein BPA30113_07234 [Burkholderia paludis]|uniref:Acyl-CoA dehydrogenase/oxidase N-terminal domain-containing protein n=1 Tax=Burkholderia paludis TaxID=1506587 RepID=A0A6J5F886_9BURK|nr:hypothetical protein LMG30113_07091 [Burkholderia paludis]VWC45116.1 hypothetical protein BPA30113_07234 [Burkholderia paludis]